MFELKAFISKLTEELKNLNKSAAADSCMELIKVLRTSQTPPLDIKSAENILMSLRNKRMFPQMEDVCEALKDANITSHKITKLYAQAEIELSKFKKAKKILKALIKATGKDPKHKEQNFEAHGLLGRVFKQLYVNAKNPSDPKNIKYLLKSIKWYYTVYKLDPSYVFQGINTIAMIERGRRDKIDVSQFPDALEIAKDILDLIEERRAEKSANAWDFASAAEACIALGKSEEALEWMSGYARMDSADAFELASTLRQLDEVWQLNMKGKTGKLLLPLLYGELLKRGEGNISLSAENFKELQSSIGDLRIKYNAIKKRVKNQYVLEKVFGSDSFESYLSLTKAIARCMAVARIGPDASNGLGTGFLLKGSSLHKSLGDKFVLITNAHVSSDDQECAVRPAKAVVTFEALNRAVEFKGLKQIWTSSSENLDATILEFAKADEPKLKKLIRNLEDYVLAAAVPKVKNPPTERIYVIGHPNGGGLQFSLADNLLLDYQEPKIHYHTPTAGGSSGSPVFNIDWELIGVHHSGSEKKQRLNSKKGIYNANEGIWIQAIKKAFAKSL